MVIFAVSLAVVAWWKFKSWLPRGWYWRGEAPTQGGRPET